MKLSVLNGCACDECNDVSHINGTPSQMSPQMNGTPSRVSPLNGYYPNDVVQSVINGMEDDDAQVYELALLMGDDLAINGLDDDESLNGWKERRAKKKEEKKAKKEKRKDRKAHSPSKERRANRREEQKKRRARREERHDKRMKGEGGGWLDSVKEIAGGLVDKFTGGAVDAAEEMYDEGIVANPEVIAEMDAQGAFNKDKKSASDTSGGDGEEKDNTMMYLLAAAAGFYFLTRNGH